ncbi:hypothetical protein [Streptomyces apocyni]|uniref:hypothetical protein n=1 Tax=Streptomyces apocyni TaxID=2654677 RepID=UPI0012EAD8CE|nr:hypothetical protein [Streptomyces apocyni]
MVVRQHGRGGGAAVAAAALVMWSTAGCADRGAAADDQTPEDAVAAVHRVPVTLESAGSAKARTAMEMATGGTRVTIRGRGTYDFKDRMGQLKVTLPQEPSGQPGQQPITELLAPGALYMKNRGAGVPPDKWVRVDTTTLSDGNLVTGGVTDPMAAAELLRGARAATYVGRTKLAGTPVRHYRGTADIGRAAKAASKQNRGSLEAAAKGFSKRDVAFDVYLDDEGRLRKIRHRFHFTHSGGPSAGGRSDEVEVASTTLLYGFGTPVNAELPAAGDIFAGKIAEEWEAG